MNEKFVDGFYLGLFIGIVAFVYLALIISL